MVTNAVFRDWDGDVKTDWVPVVGNGGLSFQAPDSANTPKQYGLAWGVTVIAANRDIRPFRLRAGVVEDESHARCRQIP